mmetsp:Transcript_66197/g.178940  ORF Transcript_66197/g.178940 Transcript_66197/m.178940 type:complete len:377 (-) Transcript_66197:26-1156(-)
MASLISASCRHPIAIALARMTMPHSISKRMLSTTPSDQRRRADFMEESSDQRRPTRPSKRVPIFPIDMRILVLLLPLLIFCVMRPFTWCLHSRVPAGDGEFRLTWPSVAARDPVSSKCPDMPWAMSAYGVLTASTSLGGSSSCPPGDEPAPRRVGSRSSVSTFQGVRPAAPLRLLRLLWLRFLDSSTGDCERPRPRSGSRSPACGTGLSPGERRHVEPEGLREYPAASGPGGRARGSAACSSAARRRCSCSASNLRMFSSRLSAASAWPCRANSISWRTSACRAEQRVLQRSATVSGGEVPRPPLPGGPCPLVPPSAREEHDTSEAPIRRLDRAAPRRSSREKRLPRLQPWASVGPVRAWRLGGPGALWRPARLLT